MQVRQFSTRILLFIFLSFAAPNFAFSQSKYAIKGSKAFAKQKWKKFSINLKKQKEKDSLSIDYLYLKHLSTFTKLSPFFSPKNGYVNTKSFLDRYSQMNPKTIELYCKKLKFCEGTISYLLDTTLSVYLNDLLIKNDTSEIQSFIKNYHDSNSIHTVQSFILHYLQKYITVEPTNTVKILEIKYAWHEAIAQKDLNAILLFRDKFPNSFCDTLAFECEAYFAFQHAMQINTLEEYQYIKDKYKRSKYSNSADSAIAIMAYNQLKDKYNIDDLVAFNAKYKNKPLNSFVSNRIIGLDKLDSVVKLVNQRLINFEPIVPQNVKIEQGSITINGAKTVKFKDQNLYQKTTQVYSYIDYLPMFDAHLIRVDNYENSNYIFVNAKTGKKLQVQGIPEFCVRIDSTAHVICKIQNRIPMQESGIQIVQVIGGELVVSQKILLDTIDYSQRLDTVFARNGKIHIKISDFIQKSSLYVPFGTLELNHANDSWKKYQFIPEIGDYQKPINKEFLENWIRYKMPIFNYGTFTSFSKLSKTKNVEPVLNNLEGCLFPIAIQSDSSGRVTIICTQKPLKGNDFHKIEKYKSLGLDLDFIYVDLNKAVSQNEIFAFPSQFAKFNRIKNIYNLNLFQHQYNTESDLMDFDYCYLLTRNLLTLDESLVKNVLTRWAVNFVQYKNNNIEFFSDIQELPLNYTVKVNLEEYNTNNHSYTVRSDKNLNEQLNFMVPSDQKNDLMVELSGVNVLSNVNTFSIEHKPTMVFNKGSESDFTIFVNEFDAQKMDKLADKNRAVYMRIRITPNLKVIGKTCKGCDSKSCDEYKLRNCKLQFIAEQYEFSASPDFNQSIVLKQ